MEQLLYEVADVQLLHETIDGLKSTTNDIVHSLNSQLTYVKRFDTATSINAMAIANLSSIVKDIVMQSHDQFQQITHDIVWLNVTLQNYSELYNVIRQLEFVLLQMIHQFYGLLGVVLQGKLPISLINPTTLQGILRNFDTVA